MQKAIPDEILDSIAERPDRAIHCQSEDRADGSSMTFCFLGWPKHSRKVSQESRCSHRSQSCNARYRVRPMFVCSVSTSTVPDCHIPVRILRKIEKLPHFKKKKKKKKKKQWSTRDSRPSIGRRLWPQIWKPGRPLHLLAAALSSLEIS